MGINPFFIHCHEQLTQNPTSVPAEIVRSTPRLRDAQKTIEQLSGKGAGNYHRIFAQIGKIIHDFLFHFKQLFKILCSSQRILYFLNFYLL